jgi:hypothetical protein
MEIWTMLSSGAIGYRHSVTRVRYSGASGRLSTIGDALITKGVAAFDDEKTSGRQK